MGAGQITSVHAVSDLLPDLAAIKAPIMEKSDESANAKFDPVLTVPTKIDQ